MYTPSIPEMMTVHMLHIFALRGIEDTIENRLEFLETVKEQWMKDPVYGSPQHLIMHISITVLINELKVDQTLQNMNL
jgi:hypothetical protein